MNDTNYTSGGFNPQQPYYQSPRRKSSKWWIPLVIIAVVLITFVAGIVAFFGFIAASFERKPVVVANNSVLYLDLSNVREYHEANPFAAFSDGIPQASFYEIVKAINIAKDDKRILGIYYESNGNVNIDAAKAEELQQALDSFRQSGKFIYSYLEYADESAYYNALPSDSIFVFNEANIWLNGFGISSVFPKGLFEKLGIEYTVIQCEDFKSYGETYINKKFSDSARLQYKVLLEQRERSFTQAVEKYRNISRTDILACLGKGLYDPDTLVQNRLADAVASRLDVIKLIESRIHSSENYGECNGCCSNASNDNLPDNFINISKYVMGIKNTPPPKNFDNDNQIAIIYGTGPIVSRAANVPMFEQGGQYIVAEEYIRMLREAADDDDIKAVILRIDSPGGSVVASEEIYQEILKVKETKPVYASMSNVAASGGYYIAMACDTIIAHPQTTTGSIGVIMAVPNINKGIDKLGVTYDTISTGHGNPFFLDPFLPISEKDKTTLQNYAYKTYNSFVTKAAKSRNKSFDEMRALAKGRVWTGNDAYRHGLIDLVGGLETAINLAKTRVDIADSMEVRLRFFPEESKKWEYLMKKFIKGNFIHSLLARHGKHMEIEAVSELLALPEPIKNQFLYTLQLNRIASQEKVILSLPYSIEVK